MSMRWIIVGGAVVFAGFFGATLWALDRGSAPDTPVPARHPPQATMPPLAPMTKTSRLIAPIAVADTAIRDALEASTPRDMSGKQDNPFREFISKGEIGWTVNRGPLGVVGRADSLAVSAPLNGTIRMTGQLGGQFSNFNFGGRGINGTFNGNDINQLIQQFATKGFDQKANLRGSVAVFARPQLLPAWRVDPNLSSQVTIGDASMPIAGASLSFGKEIKPMVDRAVAEQVAALQIQIRDNPFLEDAVRREWARMCRSLPLRTVAAGMPDLWLELRPVKAFATQPKIDADAVNLALGVEAETRVIPQETMPDCPFPAQLEIVPPIDRGKIAIATAIDLPFTEINRLIEAQLKGRSLATDAGVDVESASVAGAGDKLLIALKIKPRDSASWLGLTAPVDVYVWGRPVLDRANQIVRLTDIAIDTETQSAVGVLGTAARAALPLLQAALADRATIDLKPLAANAGRSIEAAVGQIAPPEAGVHIEAPITDVRLSGLEYDTTTLRLVAEVDGSLQVAVSALPH
jgi:hypothetical protein